MAELDASERKRRRREKHRREILDAAREVFSTKPFHKATMDEIAEKANYSPATLYLYFKNKEELYAQVNQSLPRLIAGKWREVVDDTGKSPPERIAGIFDLMHELYEQYPSNVVDTLRYQPSRDSEHLSNDVLERSEAQLDATLSTISEIFQAGIRKGLFREHEPRTLAEAVWALWVGMVLVHERKRYVDPEVGVLKEKFDEALQVFLRGLTKGIAG